MKHWLMKSEPDAFSIEDLERVGTEPWTGVRNYQARNFMKQMQPGDPVFFYHSSTAVPGVVGIAEVASAPYPDPTQFQKKSPYFDPKATREQPRWEMVDVRFVRKFAEPIALETLKANAGDFDDFALLRRGNRLSVLPVTAAQWKAVLAFEPAPAKPARKPRTPKA
jgi:predicted RNA-binding protein with PUA-like domain